MHPDAARSAKIGQSSILAPASQDTCGECHVVREADHRIANHLSLLAGFVRLKSVELGQRSTDLDNPDTQLLLGEIVSQINSVARLHRSLAGGQSTSPGLSEHLADICAPLELALCGRAELIQDFAPGCVVRQDQILPIAQIVAEVITNAIKYAHPARGHAVILACCHEDEAGQVRIEVTDNGTGFRDNFDPSLDGGLGFRLVRGLGKRLGAHLAFESSRTGLCFRMTLPATIC